MDGRKSKHDRIVRTPSEKKSQNVGRLEFVARELQRDAEDLGNIGFDVMLSALDDVRKYLEERRANLNAHK